MSTVIGRGGIGGIIRRRASTSTRGAEDHAGRRRDVEGQAGDGEGVRGRRQGAGREGQRQRARVQALRAAPRRGAAHLRVHGALRGSGRGGGPPRHGLLQGARAEDGRVHGRAGGGGPAARGGVGARTGNGRAHVRGDVVAVPRSSLAEGRRV